MRKFESTIMNIQIWYLIRYGCNIIRKWDYEFSNLYYVLIIIFFHIFTVSSLTFFLIHLKFHTSSTFPFYYMFIVTISIEIA